MLRCIACVCNLTIFHKVQLCLFCVSDKIIGRWGKNLIPAFLRDICIPPSLLFYETTFCIMTPLQTFKTCLFAKYFRGGKRNPSCREHGIYRFNLIKIRNKTRSSWLNCASRDDEAVYWVSIGHSEAVAVGNR